MFLNSVYGKLNLNNPIADQSQLSSLVLAAQELGDLQYEHSTNEFLKKTLQDLFKKLSNLKGKLSSQLMEEPLMQSISIISQTGLVFMEEPATATATTSTEATTTTTTTESTGDSAPTPTPVQK